MKGKGFVWGWITKLSLLLIFQCNPLTQLLFWLMCPRSPWPTLPASHQPVFPWVSFLVPQSPGHFNCLPSSTSSLLATCSPSSPHLQASQNLKASAPSILISFSSPNQLLTHWCIEVAPPPLSLEQELLFHFSLPLPCLQQPGVSFAYWHFLPVIPFVLFRVILYGGVILLSFYTSLSKSLFPVIITSSSVAVNDWPDSCLSLIFFSCRVSWYLKTKWIFFSLAIKIQQILHHSSS